MIELIKKIRSEIRRNSRYNIPYSIFLLSAIGSGVNIIVSKYVIPSLSQLTLLYLIILAFIFSTPVFFGFYLFREKEITKVIYNIKNKIFVESELLRIAQHKLTTRPHYASVMNFLFWFISSLNSSFLCYHFNILNASEAFVMFFGIGLLTNPIISLLCYFLVEIMSRNDMRVLEIEASIDSPKFSIRYKILFTMIFLFLIFIFLLTFVSLNNLKDMSGGVEDKIQQIHIHQTLIISGISIFYTILAAFLLSKSITDPIKELSIAMKKVQEGNIETMAHIISTDELGGMAKGFNLMTEGLRDREKIKNVFGKYVSTEIRDQILNGDFKLGGEEVYATILFCDIRGFTSISEKHSPEKIVSMLNSYFTEMVTAIKNNGGVIDKFIGDSIMATFGAPKNTGNHAKQAVSAAIEMLQRLDAHNELQRFKEEPEFQIGIGISTGKFIMGNIGSEDRLEFTSIGDTINTASRIESATKELNTTILFSEETKELLEEGYFVGELALKGKKEKVRLYSVKRLDRGRL
ncbi:MAG: adenylate/guanylate cyclase domain-containing protein [Leptospiraceae bacterium]|nr:adenylate/guanylate cyclase domain-containing protein [Leptospiraceae bacterium]